MGRERWSPFSSCGQSQTETMWSKPKKTGQFSGEEHSANTHGEKRGVEMPAAKTLAGIAWGCLLLVVSLAGAPSSSESSSGDALRGWRARHSGVYVTVVMCGRHDDKRGDFAGRLQNSLDFFISQAGAVGASLEVVVVEWNPLPGSEPLASLLRVPQDSPVVVRVITVPAWRHANVQNGTGQDFFEFMAKVSPRSSPLPDPDPILPLLPDPDPIVSQERR